MSPSTPTILSGVRGTIHCDHTLEPCKELGLGSQRAKKFASKLHFRIMSTTLPNLSISSAPFPVPLPTLIRSRFQVKPATLLIPVDLFLILLVEKLYGTQYQSGFFSLIYEGNGFHCLSFSISCS
jgi:hypothetical protein